MSQANTLRVRFDAFELDEADARLKRDGVPIALAPKAFAVLCTLARNPGALVTKDALLDAVWGHHHVSESVLKTTISELRAALSDDAKQPRYIETASRRGYRFIGTPASPPPAPVPVALTDAPPAPSDGQRPLIGREQALAKLRQCWQRTLAGQRQLVWIAGEAGVGKSRLISSFVSELPPLTAAYGQCVELFGSGEPYLPILEAIKELCRREPQMVDAMRVAAPTWLVQMPWLTSEAERANLHREVAGAHPDRMVREMRELMDRYTANRPLLFVLEDLHWSDHGTLRMMEHFARRPREVRLMWIASFRLTQVIAEDHPLRELRQELRLHGMCEEILLEPFSESEVGTYIESRIPDVSFPESFVRRLHDHTDGLPLFVANVADTLIAQAATDPEAMHTWIAAASSAPLPVPESLSGVIEKQIARLPTDTRSILEAASACGVEFGAAMVSQVLERDAFWVSEHCDELVRRQFWLRQTEIIELPDESFDSRYAFQHALYRHVFYE
ncbi:MAG TPA: AAA family ATPase, partial [Povalibacter sp.]|nr:AAA family ATPase [Povalibacter sp.]